MEEQDPLFPRCIVLLLLAGFIQIATSTATSTTTLSPDGIGPVEPILPLEPLGPDPFLPEVDPLGPAGPPEPSGPPELPGPGGPPDIPSGPAKDPPEIPSGPGGDAPGIPSGPDGRPPGIPSRPGGRPPGIPSRPGGRPPGIPSRPGDQFPGLDPDLKPTRPPPTRRPPTTMAPFKTPPPTQYRLVNNQNNPSLGRLEAFYNNTWRPVCSTYKWDDKDASVLCRQLGYESGVSASSAHFPAPPVASPTEEEELLGKMAGDVMMRRPPPGRLNNDEKVKIVYNCAGEELTLDSCPGKWVSYCYNDVGAICFSQEINNKGIDKVRIIPYMNNTATDLVTFGKVEILHRGFWGTICEKDFKEEEATTVCRKVGYRYGYKVARNTVSMRSSTNPIYWLAQFDCKGVTDDLLSCTKYKPGEFKGCSSHYYDAIVVCLNTSKPFYELEIQALRLTNRTSGRGWTMGRVEMMVEGRWGTVCDKKRYSRPDWSDDKAGTVCRQMGFRDGMYVKPGVFGKTTKPVWFYNRECPVDASSISECEAQKIKEYDCKDGGAGIFCIGMEVVDECVPKIPSLEPPFPPPPGGQRPPSGRRPPPGQRPPPGLLPPPGEDPEGETGMPNLPKPATKILPPLPAMCKTRLRLVGNSDVDPGMRNKAGRVEYYNMGLWGPICAVNFDDREAHVICKSLGFKTGRAMMNSSFGAGDGPTWLSHLNCAGNEKHIMECLNWRNKLLGFPACSKKHQAGVVCEHDEKEEVSVRLVNKDQSPHQTKLHGVVEVLYKGHWGTICSNGWDNRDASVVCRQMGYVSGIAMVNYTLGLANQPVWLEGVKCSGTEASIMDCEHSGWAKKSMYALCDHSNDAGALCITDNKENANDQPQNVVSDTAKASAVLGGATGIVHSSLAILTCVILTTAFMAMK